MSNKKPKVLNLQEKSDILELLRKGSSVTGLSKKYNVAKSTICSIRNKKDAILKCVNNTFSGPGKRKTLHTSELPKMEKSLYKWFTQLRNKNLPVSGIMIKKKAIEMHNQIKENNRAFNASDGWLQKFKKRYGIRLLKICGEKLSARHHLVEPYKEKLKKRIEELGLCNDQLYNADESGLCWKNVPNKTYVSSLEKTAPGAKMEKQRLTFMCCANAAGSHKVKLLVIGKAKNPRCFKNFNCPVNYKSSKSAWMTAEIFKDWFHRSFVPEVTGFLKEKGLTPKALLLLDNAPSHPPEAELISENGLICVMFLPPNVTSLIQPMDQNVFKIIKLHYRNTLLASIAANDSDLLESIKQITLKEAICHLELAWNRITSDLLHNCWKNILNFATVLDDCEENIPLAVLKENWDREARQLEESAAELLNILFPQADCTIETVKEWNNNPNERSTECDVFEVEEESEDDECVIEEPVTKVKPKEILEALNTLLKWADSGDIDQNDIRVLRNLKEKAAVQMLKQKQRQQEITDFFV